MKRWRFGSLAPSLTRSLCEHLVYDLPNGSSTYAGVFRASRWGSFRHATEIHSAVSGSSRSGRLDQDVDFRVDMSSNVVKVSPIWCDWQLSRSRSKFAQKNFVHVLSTHSNWWMESRFCSFAKDSPGPDNTNAPVVSDYSSLLEEESFHELADDVLHRLQEKIEVCGEDLNIEGFDSDYASGVLTVRFGSLGTYVINKQTPNRQIWLSSPVSGPARFDWLESKSWWVYRRTNAELVSLLEKELSELLAATVRLS